MTRAGGAGALVVLLGIRGAVAAEEGCEPVRLLTEPSSLPDGWQQALGELVEATKRPGQPWSCSGGTVALEIAPGGTILTVHDRKGRAVSRPVEAPSDVAPVGKALLAAPSLALSLREVSADEPPPVPPLPAPAVAPAEQREGLPPPPARDARLVLNALLGSRVSGPTSTLWGSARLAALVPIDRWGIGLWARYARPLAMPGPLPRGFSMDAADIGLSGSRVLYASRAFELRATVDPALSLVLMESGDEDAPDHPEGAAVAFRLGAGLDATWKMGSLFRGLARLDGEIAPAGLGSTIQVAGSLPAAPAYMVGLSIGAEAVIP